MLFTANDYAPVTGLPSHGFCCFCLDRALEDESIGIFRLNACGHIFHRECLEGGLDTQIPCALCFTSATGWPVIRTALTVRREREAHEERGPRLAVGFVAPAEVAPPTVTPFQSATDPCPVCMDPMRDTSVLLQCNHRFHASCLLREQRCPLCRSEAGFPTRDALSHAVYAESAGLREEVQKLTAEANSPVDTIDESVLRTLSLASAV